MGWPDKIRGRVKLKNFQTGGGKKVYPDIFIAFFELQFLPIFEK